MKKRLALLALLVALACAVPWLMWSAIEPYAWCLFFPVAFLSAWGGGLIGGLVGQRQRSRADRQHALNLLAAIIDSSNDAIFAKDLEGRYILFNPAASGFVGKSPKEVIGRDDGAIFPPAQAEMLRAIGRRVIAENGIHTQEEHVSTPHGDKIFLGTKGPLRDVDGRVIGIFGISRDITCQKQDEAALKASELSFRALFENILNGYAHCMMLFEDGQPRDFIYLNVNKAFETQTGLKNVIGRKVSEVIPGIRDTDPGLFEIYGRVAMGGGPERFEHYVEAMGMWFSILVYSPQPQQFVAVFDVVTERKAAEDSLRRKTEQLTQRNAELERFNCAMVGREHDMIALKQQVNALSQQLGLEPPYPLAFLNTASNTADPSAAGTAP